MKKHFSVIFVAVMLLISSVVSDSISVKANEKEIINIELLDESIKMNDTFILAVKTKAPMIKKGSIHLPDGIEWVAQKKELGKKIQYDEKNRRITFEPFDGNSRLQLQAKKIGTYQLQLHTSENEGANVSNEITFAVAKDANNIMLTADEKITAVQNLPPKTADASTPNESPQSEKSESTSGTVPPNSDEDDESVIDENDHLAALEKRAVTRANQESPPPSNLNIASSFHIVNNTDSFIHDKNKSQVVVTKDEKSQMGGLWYKRPIDLQKDFSMEMAIYLGGNPKGADGMALVFQNDPRKLNALGEAGAGLGAYATAKKGTYIQNALAFELDTYYNTGRNPGTDRLVSKKAVNKGHIAVQVPGIDNGNKSGDHYGLQIADSNNKILANDTWRQLKVNWDSKTQTLTYSLDDYKPIIYKVDNLAKTFGGNMVYWGFTGSTGGYTNYQSVSLVNLPEQNEATISKQVKNDTTATAYNDDVSVKVGDTVGYKIVMKNSNENYFESLNGQIIDTLDNRLDFKTGSLLINGISKSDTVWNKGTIQLGDVLPGDEKTIEFKATVKKPGKIKNTATYQADYETARESNEANVSTGNLIVNKRDGDTKKPLPGVVFQLEQQDGKIINNELETDATGQIKVNYLAPGNYVVKEKTALPGYLKDEEAHPVMIEADQSQGVAKLELNNYRIPTPEPTIDKTTDVKEVTKDQEFEYTLNAKNAENRGAWKDVVLTDKLPDSLKYVSSSSSVTVDGQTVTWRIPELAAGETKNVKLKVKVVKVPPTDTITNRLSAIGKDELGNDFKGDDATVTVKYKGGLELASVPAELNFGKDLTVKPTTKKYPLVNYKNKLTIRDSRVVKDTWQLNARMVEQLHNNQSELTDAIQFFTADGKRLSLNNEFVRLYQEKNKTVENNLSDNWSENKEGFSLLIDAGKGKPGDYKGVVEWTLSDAPAS